MFEMKENLKVKFYEDMYDGEFLLWKKDKEYSVKFTFSDSFIVENELFDKLNFGVPFSEVGTKFDVYRG